MKAVLLLSLAVSTAGSGANPVHSHEQLVLDRFLSSKDIGKRKAAFDEILSGEVLYRDIVLEKLQLSLKKPAATPDSLIYLAAYLKDPRYIDLLAKLINNADYSSDRCIYNCPVVFAMTIYRCFAGGELPTGLDSKLTPVKDLERLVKRVQSISVEPESTSKIVQGPGIDKLVQDIERQPMSAVLRIAGPTSKNARERLAAAFVLQAKITDPKYLADLYWLAETGLDDASGEYRGAIYWAIYRVETVKQKQSPGTR